MNLPYKDLKPVIAAGQLHLYGKFTKTGKKILETDKRSFSSLTKNEFDQIEKELILFAKDMQMWGNEIKPVKYLRVMQRVNYRLVIRKGKLYNKFNNVLNTKKAFPYAIDLSGNIFTGSDDQVIRNEIAALHHSSFNAGQQVICAGNLEALNGVLTYISNKNYPRRVHYKYLIVGYLTEGEIMFKLKAVLYKKPFVLITLCVFAFIATGFSLPGIHMRAVLDGQPMNALQEIQGRCTTNGRELLLMFDTVNDPSEQIADDELFFNIEIQIDNISQIPLGTPIDVSNSADIHPSVSTICFCILPLDPLTSVTGRVTINSFSNGFISGSALLSFKDPEDVNVVVNRSLKIWIKFSNLKCEVK